MDILNGSLTIEHTEIGRSPISEFSLAGYGEHRVLLCDWDDRYTLAQQLMGYVTDDGGTYYKPQKHPEFDQALVVRVTIEPKGTPADTGDTQRLGWTHAQLTVEYGNRDDGSISNSTALVTESLEPAAEVITMPDTQLYWDNGQAEPLKPDGVEAPTFVLRMCEWIYTRHQVLDLPSQLFSAVGTVNQFALTSNSLGATFPVWTLLYSMPRLTRTLTVRGWTAWEIEMRFTYRPNSWFKFLKGDGSWNFMYDSDGNMYQPYGLANFAQLF